MKSIKNIIIIAAIIAVLLAVKFIFFPAAAAEQKSGGSGKPQGPAIVTAVTVKPERISNVIYVSGTILSNREVTLMPERAGKVTAVYFTEGSKVNKGQLLLKMNDASLQAQLKKINIQEQLASQKEERQKKLLAINGISQQEYDASLTELNSLRADLALLKAQIDETEITAPFSGTLGLTTVTEGTYITPTTPVFSIQETDPLKIDFFIPERYAGMIKKADSISFTVGSDDKKHFAVISALEPKVDVSTRTLQVRALFANAKGNVIPGSDVKIELALNKDEDAIMIPTEAVIPVLKGKKVFVSRGGKAEEIMIQTGVRTENKVQVTEGLSTGDTVIVTGIMQLRKGTPIKIAGGGKTK